MHSVRLRAPGGILLDTADGGGINVLSNCLEAINDDIDHDDVALSPSRIFCLVVPSKGI